MIPFYFSWLGSKRLECKNLANYIPADAKVIVEPFAGSAAVSRAFAGNRRRVLNDADPTLMAFLEAVKKDGSKSFVDDANKFVKTATKETHGARVARGKKEETLADWFYWRRVYTYRPGLWADVLKEKTYTHQPTTDAFYADDKTELVCGDYAPILERFKDDTSALVYLDPPYLDSYNAHYGKYKLGTPDEKARTDNTQMYIDILRFMEECKCAVVLNINCNALTRHLYEPWIVKEHTHVYGFGTKGKKGRSANVMTCYKARAEE